MLLCEVDILMLCYTPVSICFNRLQEKHVKEKQCQHQRNIIELQDKLKKNQIAVSNSIE